MPSTAFFDSSHTASMTPIEMTARQATSALLGTFRHGERWGGMGRDGEGWEEMRELHLALHVVGRTALHACGVNSVSSHL